jgi:NADH-quinone oxidoreductase subunit M
MKKLIAYSSVSHMGFVTLGIFVLNLQGWTAAMMVMLAHGFNTGALFSSSASSTSGPTPDGSTPSGGLATDARLRAYFALFMFASIGYARPLRLRRRVLGRPRHLGVQPVGGGPHLRVVIFAAWYMMWMFQRVVWGRAPGEQPDPGDGALTTEERDALHKERPAGFRRCDFFFFLSSLFGDFFFFSVVCCLFFCSPFFFVPCVRAS